MYLLRDRQTRLLNVLGQIAMYWEGDTCASFTINSCVILMVFW
jgi:hypothetical protein